MTYGAYVVNHFKIGGRWCWGLVWPRKRGNKGGMMGGWEGGMMGGWAGEWEGGLRKTTKKLICQALFMIFRGSRHIFLFKRGL